MKSRWHSFFPLLVFFVSLVCLEYVWGAHFYKSPLVGHDFAGLVPHLMEGRFWINSNGLVGGLFNPPWFTPAFCAGAALYADPQSIFYSPVQVLSLFLDPFEATHLSMLLFAGIGYWGSYLLGRRIVGWSAALSTFFAVLAIVNAFLPMRSAVGQAGYQPYYLWTILVYALCTRSTGGPPQQIAIGPAVTVALVFTAWIQFGFAGMLVPAYLGALLLCCVLVVVGKADLGIVVTRTMVGILVAILLNASKLYESISLMQNFPRSFYDLPGFPSLFDSLRATVFALFLPSQWTTDFAFARLVNVQFTPLPHEWALQFGLGAMVVFFASCVVVARDLSTTTLRFRFSSATFPQWIAFVLILALSVLPTLLMWNDGTLRGLLKQIPILNSAAWPMRWVVVLIPAVQVGITFVLACAIARVKSSRLSYALSSLAIVIVLISLPFEPLGYYSNRGIQAYSRAPALEALERLKIAPIDITLIEADPSKPLVLSRNDAMFRGASESLCYNPLYGYKLEALPHKNRLRDGPALAPDDDGTSLINDPACLIHPKENRCDIGTGFQIANAEERERANNFVNRKPLAWRRPVLGEILSVVTQVSWLAMFFGLCMFGLLATRRKRA